MKNVLFIGILPSSFCLSRTIQKLSIHNNTGPISVLIILNSMYWKGLLRLGVFYHKAFHQAAAQGPA